MEVRDVSDQVAYVIDLWRTDKNNYFIRDVVSHNYSLFNERVKTNLFAKKSKIDVYYSFS
jgi:hypothetical protein